MRDLAMNPKVPFTLQQAKLPSALFHRLLEYKQVQPHVAALAQEHGILLDKPQERVFICSAPARIATSLGIAPGTPVMLLDRLLLAFDGQPVEWRVAHCNLAGGYFYLAEMS